MDRVARTLAIALVLSATAASAQKMRSLTFPTPPSAQNPREGIAGHPGNKSGPAAKPGDTVASPAPQKKSVVHHQGTSNVARNEAPWADSTYVSFHGAGLSP